MYEEGKISDRDNERRIGTVSEQTPLLVITNEIGHAVEELRELAGLVENHTERLIGSIPENEVQQVDDQPIAGDGELGGLQWQTETMNIAIRLLVRRIDRLVNGL